MLGIWIGGDSLKKDLAQPIYGLVECGHPITGWILHSLMRTISPWYFMRKYIGSYETFMVDVFLIFLLVIRWL